MFNRRWFALFLLGSVGLPYALSSSPGVDALWRQIGSFSGWSGGGVQAALKTGSTIAPSAPRTDGTNPRLTGAPIENLAEVLRFDVTTAWVLGRWPRVSTSLAELDVQGYRVPLVTGTQPDDLAGSLTYYFDKRQRVERITFSGSTGDARRLVALLALEHGFVRQMTSDPALYLYQVKEHGRVTSELTIKASSVIRIEDAHRRFNVSLVMRPPGSKRWPGWEPSNRQNGESLAGPSPRGF